MNGPVHYGKAERLLMYARNNDLSIEEFAATVAAAQAHATLALAAATWTAADKADVSNRLCDEWDEALS